MQTMILIFSTFGNKKEAKDAGKELLKKRIIACYNLVPVESAYLWKGKIEEENEVLMICKTKKENFEKVEKYIIEHSDYEIPEIVAVETSYVNKPYLDWINAETKS